MSGPSGGRAGSGPPRLGLRLRLQASDDLLGFFAREGPQGLGVLRAETLQLHQDLDRELVVGRLEDLDDVVTAHRDEQADERASRLVDDALAFLDPLAPRRKSRDAL